MRCQGLLICVACLCAGPAGCTTPAVRFVVRQPAEIDVAGINRIAVVGFSGLSGEDITATIADRVLRDGFYTVVDLGSSPPVEQASAEESATPGEKAAMLAAARQRGIDGVIVGEVISYDCSDQVLSNTKLEFGSGVAGGSGGRPPRGDLGIGYEQRESLVREANVTMAFRLIDTTTGEVRAAKRTSRSFRREMVNEQGRMPAQDEMLGHLLNGCIDEFCSAIAPHDVEQTVLLARASPLQRGAWLVSRGIEKAKQDRWDEAELLWRQASESSPANHAALYNVGIAAEARRDYAQAEEHIRRAIALERRRLYEVGLERVQREHAGLVLADQQNELRFRKVQTAHGVPAPTAR